MMPNMPDGVFPVETIKVALQDKNFPLKQYVSDVKDYQIKFMTPVYKFYVMEKDRIESLKNRTNRNKEKGVTDTADPFRDLRYWSEYAGELRPVVQILALPETGASGASMALSVIAQGIVGYGTPLSHKYKADFYQMKLMCDGKEIVPLIRNKTEIVRELQNYYKDRSTSRTPASTHIRTKSLRPAVPADAGSGFFRRRYRDADHVRRDRSDKESDLVRLSGISVSNDVVGKDGSEVTTRSWPVIRQRLVRGRRRTLKSSLRAKRARPWVRAKTCRSREASYTSVGPAYPANLQLPTLP